MKKKFNYLIILSLVLSTLNIRCSKSDNDDTKELITVKLNPPEWIVGTWLDDTQDFDWGWRFTNNDVVYINDCEKCFEHRESLIERAETVLNREGNENSYVVEMITDDYYRVIIHKVYGSESKSYPSEFSFFKRPNNQIEWSHVIPEFLLTKQ